MPAGENPGVASLSGRLGGCKIQSTRLRSASSAVKPLRGTEKEDRKVFLFCFYVCGRECELSSSFVLVSLPRGEMCASAFSSGGGGWVVNTEGKAVLCES